jgi:uncharacterized 2Fe-2S/4Fe-4S cluster protein (DUF4445 family)
MELPMKNYTVRFLPHDKKIQIPEGETLIRAAIEAGVHVNASCGGEGVCGKCRVIIESGTVQGGISERLSDEDLQKGYRLACQSLVKEDITVRVPVESTVDASVLNVKGTSRQTARIQQMDLNDLKEQGLFVPPVEKNTSNFPSPPTKITSRMLRGW